MQKKPLNKDLDGDFAGGAWVRFCTPNAGGPGSIPGQGTRSCMHAATKKPVCRN